ncbi:hypothetical protein J6590_043987 [Homalodisca vitripennis]|nr:hypothetical protein J6590_043987 [Homalodisca vitripennis]
MSISGLRSRSTRQCPTGRKSASPEWPPEVVLISPAWWVNHVAFYRAWAAAKCRCRSEPESEPVERSMWCGGLTQRKWVINSRNKILDKMSSFMILREDTEGEYSDQLLVFISKGSNDPTMNNEEYNAPAWSRRHNSLRDNFGAYGFSCSRLRLA